MKLRDLQDAIREDATEEGQRRNVSFTPDAASLLATPKQDFQLGADGIEVDRIRLREMIKDIVAKLDEQFRLEDSLRDRYAQVHEVSASDLQKVLDNIKCHYLWFC